MQNKKDLSLPGIVFLGLGSVIGSGYFLGSGLVIHMAGPAAILGYILGALLLYRVMTALCQLALTYPHRVSYRDYLEEAIGPAVGFLSGWNSWLSNIVAMSSEAVAMGIFTRFWFPHVPLWIFTTGYGLLAAAINFFGLSGVDEAEELLSSVKILSLLGFSLLAFFMLAAHNVATVSFFNLSLFFPHGFSGLGQAMLIITFSFGIGAVGVTLGRIKNPAAKVPRAIKLVSVGQAVLYVLPTMALVAIIPWQEVSAKVSPFVLALHTLGMGMLDSALNAVILSASFSLLVGSMFSGITMMVSLARAKEAPSLLDFKLGGKRGVHLYALLATSFSLLLVSLVAFFLPKTAYVYVTSSAGFYSMITWLLILSGQLSLNLSHWRHREKPHWAPLITGFLGILTVLTIFVLSLQAQEQRHAAIFPLATTTVLVLIILIKKLYKRHK